MTSGAGIRVGLAATALIVGAANAAGSSTPVYQAPQGYYLALGDSITYGFQPTKRAGAPASTFNTGYVDVFAARLRKLSPKIQVVNYGCPGETTVTFVRGPCPGLADGFKLHDPYSGSQLTAAKAFLRAHPGQVSPITMTLWGNDWFALLLDTCKGDAACLRKHAPGAIATIASHLTSSLRQLRAAAPRAELIVTGALNPDPTSVEQLRAVYQSLEAAIARAASAAGARIANVLPVFNPTENARARLCTLLFICSKGDPHPTDAGYRAFAEAVLTASGYPRR